MFNEFSQPAPIVFGAGSISILGERVKALGCKTALCIYDKGVEDSKIASRAVKILIDAGIDCITFNGVLADPTDSIVDAAGDLAKATGADCLIGIGGGSSMDTAKATSILLDNPGPARKYILPAPTFYDTKTPIFLIPTTSGTGSECTSVAIISIPDLNVKWSAFVNTTLAIVDPELTISLPKNVTVNSGLDAFAHAAEAITGLNWNHHSDLFGEAAIRKITRHLFTCYNDPGNIEARSELALAANWAGLAFNNPITHVGHAMADAFSGHFHTPHGLNCALALPCTMEFVAPAVPEKMRTIANAMELSLTGNETGEELGKAVAEGIWKMMRSMDMPSLKAMGYSREKVISFASDVAASHLSGYSPVPVTEEVAAELLARVYDTYQ